MTGPSPLPVPALWSEPIAAWSVSLTAAGRTGPTIATRTDHIRRIARALRGDPWGVTTAALVAWAGQQHWSRETRRSVYASARGFWRWAVQAGRVAASPAEGLPSVKPSPPLPRPAPDAVIREAMSTASPRTILILRLASELGLRRAEIAQVHHDDLSRDADGWSILVHGKGERDRMLPLPEGLATTLRLACGAGWAFPGRDHGHLSPRHVGILASRALPGTVTLHQLRHRCATVMHDGTGDLLLVQQLLGHASVATTQRYVAPRQDKLRHALAVVA